MTKYKIQLSNTIIEFLTEQEAINYKALNNLDAEIVSFESEVIKPAIPNVTNQQLRTALVIACFSQNKPQLHPDQIKTFLETLAEPDRSLALQQWEYSNEMIRDNPLVNSMAPMLGITAEEVDAIWLYAGTL